MTAGIGRAVIHWFAFIDLKDPATPRGTEDLIAGNYVVDQATVARLALCDEGTVFNPGSESSFPVSDRLQRDEDHSIRRATAEPLMDRALRARKREAWETTMKASTPPS